MKKIVVLFLALILVMALVSGVLAKKVQAAERVKLRVQYLVWVGFPEWVEPRLEEYMKINPNVEIDYTSSSDMGPQTTVMFEAKNAPEVLMVYYPYWSSWARAGYLDVVPSYIAEDIIKNFCPTAVMGGMVDGKLYGYAKEFLILPIVNVDMFEESGVPFPTTLAEWKTANEKMTIIDADGMKSQIGVGFTTSGVWITLHWGPWLWGYGGKYLNDTRTEVAFNSPAGIESAKDYLTMVAPELGDHWAAFYDGRNASQWSIVNLRPMIEENAPDINFKAISAPKGKDGKPIATVYYWNWVVNGQSDQTIKDEAWKLVKWLNNTENEISMTDECLFGPPERYDNQALPKYKEDLWISKYVSESQYSQRLPSILGWLEIEQTISTIFERMITGEISVEEGLAQAEREVNEIIKRNR